MDFFDKKGMELEKKAERFGTQLKNNIESKTKLLNTTINQVSNVSTVGNEIEENIGRLNEKIIELDPSKVDFSKKVGMFFNPVKKYFNKYKQYDLLIGIIIEDLEKEKQILERDNITLGLEMEKLNDVIEQLDEAENEGILFKNELQNIIDELEATGEKEKAQDYKKDILEVLEKRLFDIKEMKIVKQQTIMAFDIIRRNNKELIRNVDRVKNVTISSLRTAVLIASTLYNQKIVLNKINSIELASGKVVSNVQNVLEKENNQKILQESFNNVILTINDVSENNKKCLPESTKKIIELKNMEGNINEGE